MSDPRVAAVFFDMDETLVEHTMSGMELIQDVYETFKQHLAGVDEPTFARTIWRKANDLWKMMFDGVLTGEVARPYTFINTLRQLKCDDTLGHQMLEHFEVKLLDSTRLAEDALDVLGTLKEAGIRTAIITNGYKVMQTRKIEHHGLHEHVDFVFVSEAVGFHKPHSAIFELALGKAGRESAASHVRRRQSECGHRGRAWRRHGGRALRPQRLAAENAGRQPGRTTARAHHRAPPGTAIYSAA